MKRMIIGTIITRTMKGNARERSRWELLFILIPSMFIMMGGAVVAPALPEIAKAFPDASQFLVSLIVTVPGTAIAVTGFGLGYLADRMGKVRMLALSALLLGVSGSAGYFLDSLPLIIVSRFFLGMSIGGFTVAATALITEYYTGNNRVYVIGLQAASMGAGVFILELLGGFLADIGWRESFLPYLIGIPLAAGIILTMKEPVPRVKEENVSAIEEKIDVKKVAACYAVACLGLMLAYVLPTMLPYSMSEIGMTGVAAGLFIGWFGLCEVVSSLLYMNFVCRLNRFMLLALAFGITGIGYCLMLDTSSVPMTVASLALIGFGLGMVTPAAVDWLAELSGPGNSGKIMGGYSSALNLGPIMSSVIAMPILAAVAGYGAMYFTVGMLALLLSLICALPLIMKKMPGRAKG